MTDNEGKKSKVSMLNMKSHSGIKSQMALRSASRLRVRRQSYGFSGVPGIRPVERTSQVAFEFKRPPLTHLPTYQLEPSYRFHVPLVRKISDELLDEHFTGHKYNVQESPALALRIAGELMRKIKALQFSRYRVITVVTIGQKRAQSYNNAISFLWDHERDDYVDLQREVNTAFIQVTTFAGLYEQVAQRKVRGISCVPMRNFDVARMRINPTLQPWISNINTRLELQWLISY